MTAAVANGLASVIEVVLNMVQVLIFASIIVSWVGADPRNQIVQMINRITEPMYKPLRGLTSKIPGPFDWAPMILILIIIFLQKSLVAYLKNYAATANFQ
jgi:YggT family protein